ncbi:MAG: MATE family efflux transporter [Spirochaetaceae bacterium]|nr:MATE family efflux transporter [Spirochaetaceae bacterium]
MSVQDMTVGSPSKHLLSFALPLLFGNLFQQLYNMVDSVIVGRFVGANALGAVGACGSLNFLFFSLSSGLALGIGIIVSQYFGAGDEKNVRTMIANSIYVLASAVVVVSTIAVVFAPLIMRFLRTPDEIIKDATLYLQITGGGMVFITLYNGISAILRALGDSKTPLYFLVLSSIINIILDLVFVVLLHWGVAGVAIATVIAQTVSGVACLVFSIKKISYFRLTKKELELNWRFVGLAFKLGIPIALQNSLIAISCVVLQSVVNSFGALAVAAFTITNRIEMLVQQPYGSLGMATSTFSGQNIGAHKIERVNQGLARGALMAFIFSALMLPVMYLFGHAICSIFVKDEDVITMGMKALRITSWCYFPLGMIYVPRGLLNGAGDTTFSMINGITEVICRVSFSLILTKIAFIGVWGIWATNGATWTLTAIVCVIRYFSGVWKRKGLT